MIKTELIERKVTIKSLLDFYDLDKVEGYCKNCENYNQIWSCPGHDFNPYDYLSQFDTAHLYALKIYLPEGADKDQVLEIFQNERRAFSDKLMTKEEETVALIAGNCYQCETCERLYNRPCRLKDKMRYSLESLGLKVGDITSDLMGIELKWSKGGKGDYLVTVGALLK
ncbi:hypothetical protein EZV73_18945 [Acidaminobacter sp. JC074]|uniref:DUF2284 domain-containing protein n=1 Tax=Acidaminobacter sp. JC074 TaxID=2530199 RepID=UPI001F0F8625|nr:DUF2284 domain-containing protein [Acidaminobacter sp. JC074]MCH4889667.1 hypothetical protein [Acidaminobacter sp. JC074]